MTESEDLNEDQATNQVFRRASDVKFLEQSINILHLLATYQDLEETSVRRKDLTRRILQETKFVRLVYEEMLQKFLTLTEVYQVIMTQATEVHSALHWAKSKAETARLSSRLVDLHGQLDQIENSVQIGRTYLYHVRESVVQADQEYKKLRNRIYEPYLRIVYKEAKRHATNEQQIMDNFQNGSQGLVRAISCYNLDRNVSFSSYAHWWIRQSILFHIKDSSNFVKLPVTTWQTYTAVEKKRNAILSKRGADTLEVLAEETGQPVEKLQEIYDSVKSSHVHSLDYEMDDTGKLMLLDVIQDNTIEDRENQQNAQTEILERFRFLDPEQRWIVIMIHGLFSLLPQDPLSRAEIMVEKIRQLLALSCK